MSSCCIRNRCSVGEESHAVAALPARGSHNPPKKGTTATPAARGRSLGVLCPEPPSHPNGLCYPTAAAAAPAFRTGRWDGAMVPHELGSPSEGGLCPGSWHGIGATSLRQESCSWLFRAVKALDFPGSTWSLKAGERGGGKNQKSGAQK